MKFFRIFLLIFIIHFIIGCKPPKFIRKFFKRDKSKITYISQYHQKKFSDDFDDIVSIENKHSNMNSLSLIISKTSNNNLLQSSTLKHSKIKKPKMLTIMPQNIKQYKSIYKSNNINQITMDNINKFKSKSENIKNIKEFDGYSTKDFFDFLRKSTDDPLVIFAHSIQKGKKIVLPNGAIVDVKLIHKKCIEENKNCLVLTCNGSDFNIKGKVTAIDALQIWERSIDKIHINMTVEDLKEIMQFNREIIVGKRKIYLTFSLSIVAGTTYIVSSKYKPITLKKLRKK